MTRDVLVARLDNDGDVLLAGPAVRAPRAAADRVTLLCGPRGAAGGRAAARRRRGLVRRAPWIDPEPAPVERGRIDALSTSSPRGGSTQAVVLTSFHQSAAAAGAAAAPGRRAARSPRISEDFPGSLLDRRATGSATTSTRSSGRCRSPRAAGFALPAGDDGRLRVRRRAGAALAGARPYVVVHPGASVPARAWAPERTPRRSSARSPAPGRRVVVTGAPASAR